MKTTRIRLNMPQMVRCISLPSSKNVPLTVEFDPHQVLGFVDVEFDEDGDLYAIVPTEIRQKLPDHLSLGLSGVANVSSMSHITLEVKSVNLQLSKTDMESMLRASRSQAVSFPEPATINVDAKWNWGKLRDSLELVWLHLLKDRK